MWLLAFFGCIISVWAQSGLVYQGQTYVYARIAGDSRPLLPSLWDAGADDHALRRTPYGVETILPRWGVDSLQSWGFTVEVLIPDMELFYAERLRLSSEPPRMPSDPRNFRYGSMNGFYRLEEIFREFARMQEFFPQAVAGHDTLGFSVEGRPILGYRFSLTHRPDAAPAVLYTALHHAREPGSVTVLVYFLWWLLERAAAGDPEALFLLQNRLLYVVPVLNPDGYTFNEEQRPNGGGMWRKNRRPNPDGSFGVDLNRNYGPLSFWDAPNAGSSQNPRSEVYRGPAPFSEPELQAIRTLLQRYPFRIALNYHTYSNLLIYPFAALERESPDSLLYRLFAAEATRWNLYSTGRDIQTVGYSARGVSDDWMYDTSDGGKPKVLAMTPEVGTILDGFWPPMERLLAQARETLWLNLQAAWSAGANVRPLFFTASWHPTPLLWLQCCNIGTAPSESTTLSLRLLRPGLQPASDSTIALPPLLPAECRRLSWEYAPLPTWVNGDSLIVEILAVQDGVPRRDTIALPWGQPTVLPLFTSAEMAHLWELNGWASAYDSTLMTWTLKSPLAETYPDSASLYATLRTPISIPSNSRALLELWARWSIEANYDVATVEISTDGGTSWQWLKSERMKRGLGLRGSRQEENSWGWDGHFPLWFPQRFDLTPFAGRKVLLRFGLLSDPAIGFHGVSVAQVRLLIFERAASSVSEKLPDTSPRLFPQPARRGNALYVQLPESVDGSIAASLFSSVGSQITTCTLPVAGGMGTLLLPAQLSPGLYFLHFQWGAQRYCLPCPVLP